MKFNVQVEIDWINEDYSLDEGVSNEIRKKVAEKAYEAIQQTVSEKISAQIDDTLDAKIMETYDNFMSKEFTVYDKWGEVVKKETSVKGMLKEKLDKFFTEKVDKNGKPSNYGGEERYLYILNKHAQKKMDEFSDKLAKSVLDDIKSDLVKYSEEKAIKKVAKAVFSNYQIKQLID
jgi:hypothetical protein